MLVSVYVAVVFACSVLLVQLFLFCWKTKTKLATGNSRLEALSIASSVSGLGVFCALQPNGSELNAAAPSFFFFSAGFVLLALFGDNMEKIYVLQLKEGKWYVGKSANPDERFKQHIAGTGPEWTQLYEPICILSTIPCDENKYKEDNTTFDCMRKYGIQNVRGGSFTAVNLDDYTVRLIQKQIDSGHDQCFSCHKEKHLAKKCAEKKEGAKPGILDGPALAHLQPRNPRMLAGHQSNLLENHFGIGQQVQKMDIDETKKDGGS